jgi:pimeloyl-ACP methyl ester carboxylesterase
LSVLLTLPLAAASLDGAKVHWSSAGSGSATLIFVHGWTCDESSWQEQVPALSKKYRVITLDLPGHGQSDPPKDGKFSMDVFANAVEAVRKEAKVEKAVLIGHSMGTPVIRQYARLYPKHVTALVLVDGLVTFPGAAAPGAAGGTPQLPPMTGPEGLKARETMIRGMFTPSTPPEVQQHVLKMMLGAPEATATGAMSATFDSSNWKDEVMTFPVLGIYADKSRLGGAGSIKKVFPALEYVEIPGTGHFVMLEKPDEFNRLLMAFVAKLRS